MKMTNVHEFEDHYGQLNSQDFDHAMHTLETAISSILSKKIV
jgi:hypothetical protein